MNLQELLGEAYKEGMSLDEINSALQSKKLVDLSTGGYVDVNKHNKEIQELQNKYKADIQKAQEKNSQETDKNTENQNVINSLQEQLKQLTLENNKSNATANISDARRILEIKDTDTEYIDFIEKVSGLDKDTATSISSYLNKQIKAAYEKGKQDNIKNELGNMGKQKGSSGDGKVSENFGKQLADRMKTGSSDFSYFSKRK